MFYREGGSAFAHNPTFANVMVWVHEAVPPTYSLVLYSAKRLLFLLNHPWPEGLRLNRQLPL